MTPLQSLTHWLGALAIGIGAGWAFARVARLCADALRNWRQRRARAKAHLAAATALAEQNRAPVITSALWPERIDPSNIPDTAQSVRWEACHLWPASAPKPTRHRWGVDCPEPPLAMACPDCDLRQPVLHPGHHRTCAYCGSHLLTHGSRVFWWRSGAEPEPTEWSRA